MREKQGLPRAFRCYSSRGHEFDRSEKALLPDSLAARVSTLTIKEGRAIAIVDAAGLGERERGDIERAITDILGQRDDVPKPAW